MRWFLVALGPSLTLLVFFVLLRIKRGLPSPSLGGRVPNTSGPTHCVTAVKRGTETLPCLDFPDSEVSDGIALFLAARRKAEEEIGRRAMQEAGTQVLVRPALRALALPDELAQLPVWSFAEDGPFEAWVDARNRSAVRP